MASYSSRSRTAAHSTYTAQDVAAIEHISGKLMAKVVLVFADGKLTMLILPASHRVNLARVGPAIGAKEVVQPRDLHQVQADQIHVKTQAGVLWMAMAMMVSITSCKPR